MRSYKRLLVVLIPVFLLALVGCKKDTDTDEYIKGREYVRTFYVSDIDYELKNIDISILDNRRAFIGVSFSNPLTPRDLTKPNLEETDDLKLYQVADFKFIHGQQGPIEEIYTKTREWRWVYGRAEEYIIRGYTFKRIVIVKEI